MASISDSILHNLPREYAKFRDTETISNIWNPILYQEMSRHWDMIKEGIEGFCRAHSEVEKALKSVERDETAELVLNKFLLDRFPSALDLVKEMKPLVNQYPSNLAKRDNDDDNRSVTMDVEPGPSNHRREEASMAPPPRPVAPMTPVTPTGSKDARDNQNAREQAPGGAAPEPHSPGIAHGALVLQQTAKRTLDAVEVDHHPRTPEPPTKKTKSSSAVAVPGPAAAVSTVVTKSVSFWEVEGERFIFKDEANCGPGWFVVQCEREQQVPFLREPLRGNVAMDHFNDADQKCHDSRRIYTFDDILREFTYRVYDTSGDMTEERVRSANERLQREHPTVPQRGSAKKTRKGKERAGPSARFTATNARPVGFEANGNDQEEAF